MDEINAVQHFRTGGTGKSLRDAEQLLVLKTVNTRCDISNKYLRFVRRSILTCSRIYHETGPVSFLCSSGRVVDGAYNFEVNGRAAKGREAKMPIDLESLQTIVCDSAQRVL